MFNFRRIVIPCALLILLGAIAITKFHFYVKNRPFYVTLKKKRGTTYRVHNIKIHKSAITGDIIEENDHFPFKLSFPSDEIVHFQLNDPSDSRYTVKDVVVLDQGNLSNIDLSLEETNELIHIQYKNLLILINSKNFQIDIFKNDALIVSINHQKNFFIGKNEPNVEVVSDFFFPEAIRAYGLAQHAENLSLRTTRKQPYRLYNVDRFAYSATNHFESLYGSVPVLYAHGCNRTTGLFWLNSSETYVDLNQHSGGLNAVFYSESGALDFYILSGPSLQECSKQNAQLTGVAPLPPLFALGYHQSRFSYMTQDEVEEVSDKFDKNQLPLDSIWLDIDYTDNKKYFTWNPETYDNPEDLLKFLEARKRHAVAIIDPHIKVDENYSVYFYCYKRSFFIKNPDQDQTPFSAKCWPGLSSWIDFFNPEARRFYSNLHDRFARAKNLQIWNDMNEPALFETAENSMPKNVLHHGNWKHRDVHNLYGFYQTMATYEGLLKRTNHRPFILTRSHFAGNQRFAAIWTGDNTATWNHLQISIPMCLTASLSGFSLCGADIGGFVHHPSEELLQRWYQVGAWLPFFRGHSNRNVPRREPYLYSEPVLNRIRHSLLERYKHLHYWYTLFWQHYTTMEPVIRPLVYQYTNDQNVLDLDKQFLVGKDILVCPVMNSKANQVKIYLPGGTNTYWYHLPLSKVFQYSGIGWTALPITIDTVPVFYRGGSIIPIVENFMKSSADIHDHPITLYVFCDSGGDACGSLYKDDGESFDYLRNVYCYLKFNFKNGTLSGFPINQNSSYDQSVILTSVNLYGSHSVAETAKLQTNNFSKDLKVIRSNNFLQICDIAIDIQENFTIHLNE